MNSERKAFEEAIKKISGGDIKNQINEETGEYLYGVMQVMWVVWQASAQRQGYKLVPVEPTKAMFDAYGDNSIAPVSMLSRSGYKAMIGAVDEI